MLKCGWGKRFRIFFLGLTKNLKKEDWYKLVDLLIKIINLFKCFIR